MRIRNLAVSLWLCTAIVGISGCGGQPVEAPGATPPAATPPAATEGQTRSCPVCKQSVPADAKYCRRCGSRLR